MCALRTLKVISHNFGGHGIENDRFLDLIADYDIALLQEIHDTRTIQLDPQSKWSSYVNGSTEGTTYGGTAVLLKDKVRGLEPRTRNPVQPTFEYRRYYVTLPDKPAPEDLYLQLTPVEEAEVTEQKMQRGQLFKYGMFQRLKAKVNGTPLELWNVSMLPHASNKNGALLCKALIRMFTECLQCIEEDAMLVLAGNWNAVQKPTDRKRMGTYGTYWVDDEMEPMWKFFDRLGLQDVFVPKRNYDGTHAAVRDNYSHWNEETSSHSRTEHVHANAAAVKAIGNVKHLYFESMGNHAFLTFEIDIPGSENWTDDDTVQNSNYVNTSGENEKGGLMNKLRKLRWLNPFRKKTDSASKVRRASSANQINGTAILTVRPRSSSVQDSAVSSGKGKSNSKQKRSMRKSNSVEAWTKTAKKQRKANSVPTSDTRLLSLGPSSDSGGSKATEKTVLTSDSKKPAAKPSKTATVTQPTWAFQTQTKLKPEPKPGPLFGHWRP